MANENNEDNLTPNLPDISNKSENADYISNSGKLTTEEVITEDLTPEELTTDLLPEEQVVTEEITPEALESQREDTVDLDSESEEAEDIVPEENVAKDSQYQNTEAMSVLRQIKTPSAEKKDSQLQEQVDELEQSLRQELDNAKKQIEVRENELKIKNKEIEKLGEEIASSKEESTTKDQKIEELQKENKNKEQKIEDLQEKLNTTPEIKFLKKQLQKQEADLGEDQQEFDNYSKQIQTWKIRNQTLQKEINSAVENSNKILSQSRNLKNKLPNSLLEKLQKRQEGLNLIGKMLNRLQAQINEKIEDTAEPEELPTASEQELRDLLESNQGQKAIAKKLKEVSTQRWKIISQRRDLAEKLRKKWLNIIDKKILPILDGINDGKKFSNILIEKLKTDHLAQTTELDHWFRTYDLLQEILLKMLESVKVYPMNVGIGRQIDYNRHEPFDVQSDATLKNEDVKEVTRKGYEYDPEAESQELLVLRSAQVVVIKND